VPFLHFSNPKPVFAEMGIVTACLSIDETIELSRITFLLFDQMSNLFNKKINFLATLFNFGNTHFDGVANGFIGGSSV